MTSMEKKPGLETAAQKAMSRRQFLKRMGLLGGGLVIYGTIGPYRGVTAAGVPSDFNAFLRIGEDNRVTCFVGKIEMGQGPVTSFAQMMAEELDVTYESVDMVMGDTARCPWDAGTWGSLSTRQYGVFVKNAACEAKAVLRTMAAEHLKCPESRLMAKNGVFTDNNHPERHVAYGRLTRGKVIERHLTELPPLKPYSEYTISGRPYLRRDAREKVTG